METVSNLKDIKNIKDNQIIISNTDNVSLENTNINFNGKNNILYIDSTEKVSIKNSNINFKANNSIIFLSSNRNPYIVDLAIYNNSVIYFGMNNYINNKLLCVVSEERNVIIGNGCLFSYGICIRTADPHLLYNSKDYSRINPAKSVFIGDHVWIGQNVTILKGSKIGSGSVIGAASLIAKKVCSNSVYGGNPAKSIKQDIFWTGYSTHAYTNKETKDSMTCKTDKYIYNQNNSSYFKKIDKDLYNIKDSSLKLEYLKDELSKDCNRFCIIFPTKKQLLKRKIKKRLKKVFKVFKYKKK